MGRSMAGLTIINGKVYYDGDRPDITTIDDSVANINTDNVIRRDIDKHRHELIQPWNPDGTPNEDFIAYYPDEAKDYGMIKEDDDEHTRDARTANE